MFSLGLGVQNPSLGVDSPTSITSSRKVFAGFDTVPQLLVTVPATGEPDVDMQVSSFSE